MDLREVGYDDRDWINLAQDRDRWRAYLDRGQLSLFNMRIDQTRCMRRRGENGRFSDPCRGMNQYASV
ncbi:hypothetical protein ANN_08086 [Periplaneta americana]|uniref:Uncharacterized protein n=1 Tax=Periplaneta americana TaxID=6978 RepID=A0ABQ8T214_PERAM|nr:hypothetical protein ANN_08086 [Periplaneta americana]